MLITRKIILLYLSLLVVFALPNFSYADCCPARYRRIDNIVRYQWFEYRCYGGRGLEGLCGGIFQKRKCRKVIWEWLDCDEYWSPPDEYGNRTCSTDWDLYSTYYEYEIHCGIPAALASEKVKTETCSGGICKWLGVYRFNKVIVPPAEEGDWETIEIGQPWERCIGGYCEGYYECKNFNPHKFRNSFFNACDGACIGKPKDFKIFTNPTKDFRSFNHHYLKTKGLERNPQNAYYYIDPIDKDGYINRYEQIYIDEHGQRQKIPIVLPFFADWSLETVNANIETVRYYLRYRGCFTNRVFLEGIRGENYDVRNCPSGIDVRFNPKIKDLSYADFNLIFNHITGHIVDEYRFRIAKPDGTLLWPKVGFFDGLFGGDAFATIDSANPAAVDNIQNEYHSAFRQPGPCFLRILKEYNAQIRVMCCPNSGWNTDNASKMKGSGIEPPTGEEGGWFDWDPIFDWGDDVWTEEAANMFITSAAPEIRIIIGGEIAKEVDEYIEDKNLPPLQSFLFGIIRLIIGDPGPFHYTYIDVDWEGEDYEVQKIKEAIFKGMPNLIPPILIDWCDLCSEEEDRIKEAIKVLETKRIEERHRREIARGKDPMPPLYFKPISKADRFFSIYEIRFYKYYEHYKDNELHSKWIPHFRFETEKFKQGFPFRSIYFHIELVDGGLKEVSPPFFLDRNRYFLTYDTKYRVELRRLSLIKRWGRVGEGEMYEEMYLGRGSFQSILSQQSHFKTEGDETNLIASDRIIIPQEYYEDYPGERNDAAIQPIPFRPEFAAVSGANYHFFELFPNYPHQLKLYQENVCQIKVDRRNIGEEKIQNGIYYRYYERICLNYGVCQKKICQGQIERDGRDWLGIEDFYTEFRAYPDKPVFPLIISRLDFSYEKDILRDFTLKLDREYTLRIVPCLADDYYSLLDLKNHSFNFYKDCNFAAYKSVVFKTPGAPPTGLRTISERDDAGTDGYIIPVSFAWDHMRGVNSFKVQIYYGEDQVINAKFITTLSNITIGYPYLLLDRNYTVKVWSCVDRNGQVCADKFCGHAYCLPAELDFRTFILNIPDVATFTVSPEYPEYGSGRVKTRDFITFDWGSVVGAAYYQIKIIDAEGTSIKRIVNTNQFTIHQRHLVELGRYTWQVRACIDPACRKEKVTTSEWSFLALFELLPAIEIRGGRFGLVVCGRLIDNPHTGWNEREACTIRHIPLMAHVLIDFALFDVVPLIIVVLIMLTGFFYYTAFANAGEYTQITPKVKKLWKAFGIGFFILFFGFTIINVFLGIIGFNVYWFGIWYGVGLY